MGKGALMLNHYWYNFENGYLGYFHFLAESLLLKCNVISASAIQKTSLNASCFTVRKKPY